MTVADVMTKNPVTVSACQTLSSALQTMRLRRVNLLPVVEDGKLVGLVTDRDPCWSLPDVGRRAVGTVMDRRPEHVRPETTLREAARALLSRGLPALLVVDQGRLLGLLSPRDLLRASLDELEAAVPVVTTLLAVPQGGRLGLAEISSLIRASGGDLLSTLREPAEGPAIGYRLRVKTQDSSALIDLLQARGHRVVTATTEREGAVTASTAASP